MLHRPRFKAHYHGEWIENEGFFLLSEQRNTRLHGTLYEHVAPLIDGCRSLEEIIEQTADRLSAAEVYYVVDQLEKQGFLVESHDLMPAADAAYWELQGIDSRVAAQRLAKTGVAVSALGNVAADLLDLQSIGVQVCDLVEAQLRIVLTDDYLHTDLSEYNRNAIANGQPWMLVRPTGSQIWIGPIFHPERTGCWECLAQRLRNNRRVEVYVKEKKSRVGSTPVFRAATQATWQIAGSFAANEIASWIAHGGFSKLEGKILSIDLLTHAMQTHTLVRRPQCHACGEPIVDANSMVPPLVLRSLRKNLREDGGYRAVLPEVTLKRFGHHVSPITGAVALLERTHTNDDENIDCEVRDVIHVYRADENLAIASGDLNRLRRGLRASSSGKGTSDYQAKASGLCEALERYSGVFQGYEPRRKARLRDLGSTGIHPNACMRFSDKQYADRDTWNANHSHFNQIPRPFDEEAAIDWSPVWSLTHQDIRFLPTAYCYFAYPGIDQEPDCSSCSNGNAAGNTREEAILQGFLELVERDSVAIWWYNRLIRPKVDLDSFDDLYLLRVRGYLANLGRELWVLDLTSDLGIPVFAALSRCVDQRIEKILFGFGAHFDPKLAVLRAVSELMQMSAWLFEIDRPGTSSNTIDDPETLHWLETATLISQPYLAPDTVALNKKASDFSRAWTDDLLDDVLACQSIVEQHGMEMLVLDQTRRDIGLPVVKVIVPGLRHFWARFGSGRLYDVPVQMGWLSKPLKEEQLNPIPLFV